MERRTRRRSLAQAVVANKIDPLEAIEQGLSKGMTIIGDKFECGEAYLPELLMAAASFNAAMAVLKPEIEAQKKQIVKLGKVLIGTVKGDVHSIGKDIVASVLDTSGFEVVDMGVDNPSLNIIQQAEKIQADVIALSSVMTTTMPAQKEVIDTLKEMGIRREIFRHCRRRTGQSRSGPIGSAPMDTASPPSMPWRLQRA